VPSALTHIALHVRDAEACIAFYQSYAGMRLAHDRLSHGKRIVWQLDGDLFKQSSEKIRKLGLDKTARIINGDIMAQDFSAADLLTVYLLPSSNDKIRPMLEKQLKKGARVVSHDFEFSGWTAEKVESIDDDGEGRSHTLYLYRR